MSYYDTIDDDVKRAKEILEKGRLKDDDFYPDVEPDLKARLVADSGHIFGGDTYAAYKLLESFVAEIERLQPWREAIIDACVVDWIFTKEHDTDPRKAVNDLLAWQQQIVLDPTVSKEAAELHDRITQQAAEITELREALLALQEHLSATKRCDFPEHAEASRLRALVDAVGEDVCKTAWRLQKRLHDQS